MALVLNGTTGVQGNSGAFVAGTAVASTSGTSIDFTGIPSWVKRITVMFNAVSTNGSSVPTIQLGTSSGVASSGYSSQGTLVGGNTYFPSSTSTSAFLLLDTGGYAQASSTYTGAMVINNISSNTFVGCSQFDMRNRAGNSLAIALCSGVIALGGTLDRVRITTVNGTDSFDAGSINILYE
jgi:hypothetical protein